ncbi:MAG: zf-HC2 domain-containing protein [Minicystis sp.]
MSCATEDELIALLDGEVTENRAAALRAHLERCAACRETWASLDALRGDLAAPLAGVPLAGAAERILARIEAAPAARPARSRRRAGAWIGAALGVAAVAAAIVLVPRLGREREIGELAARGASSPRSLRRDVGVTVFRAADRLVPLVPGEAVGADTTYAASYRNLGPDGTAFLMVFAVDAGRTVHWIHPAYLDAKTDPASVPLAHALTETVLPGAAALDQPAHGALRIVTLISAQPIHVSQIEALGAADLSLERLRARFEGAEIAEIDLTLRLPGSAP